MEDKRYALQWYHHAIETKDESFMRFMMHWMGFNWMYNNSQRYSLSKETERTQIYSFVKTHESLLKTFDFKRTPAFEIFKNYRYESYVEAPDSMQKQYDCTNPLPREIRQYGWRRINNNTKIYKIDESYGIRDVSQMFMALYTVRCNLFHGSKSPENGRDIEIVKSVGEILEGFMNTLIPVMEEFTY